MARDIPNEAFIAELKDIHLREDTLERQAEIMLELGRFYHDQIKPNKENECHIFAAALFNAAMVRTRSPELAKEIKNAIAETLNLFLTQRCEVRVDWDLDESLAVETKRHKKQLLDMRTACKEKCRCVEEMLLRYTLKADGTELLRQEQPIIEQAGTVFQFISDEIKTFVGDLISECIDVLGAPPCPYAFIGLGSLARDEATPYSDLEFAIIVHEDVTENEKDYFYKLTDYLHLKVLDLGESMLPGLSIPLLNDFYSEDESKVWFYDSFTPSGFKFDGSMPWACKTPRGRKATKNRPTQDLIMTPSQMVAIQKTINTDGDAYHLADVLFCSTFICGHQSLYNQYNGMLPKVLDRSHMWKRGVLALNNDLAMIASSGTAINAPKKAKHELYRMPSLIMTDIRFLLERKEVSTWHLLKSLRAEIESNEYDCLRHLSVQITLVLVVRLLTYCQKDRQHELVSFLPEIATYIHGPSVRTDPLMKRLVSIDVPVRIFASLYICRRIFLESADSGTFQIRADNREHLNQLLASNIEYDLLCGNVYVLSFFMHQPNEDLQNTIVSLAKSFLERYRSQDNMTRGEMLYYSRIMASLTSSFDKTGLKGDQLVPALVAAIKDDVCLNRHTLSEKYIDILASLTLFLHYNGEHSFVLQCWVAIRNMKEKTDIIYGEQTDCLYAWIDVLIEILKFDADKVACTSMAASRQAQNRVLDLFRSTRKNKPIQPNHYRSVHSIYYEVWGVVSTMILNVQEVNQLLTDSYRDQLTDNPVAAHVKHLEISKYIMNRQWNTAIRLIQGHRDEMEADYGKDSAHPCWLHTFELGIIVDEIEDEEAVIESLPNIEIYTLSKIGLTYGKETYLFLGQHLASKGHLKLALRMYNIVMTGEFDVRLHPMVVSHILNVGCKWIAQGRDQEAKNIYDDVMKRMPEEQSHLLLCTQMVAALKYAASYFKMGDAEAGSLMVERASRIISTTAVKDHDSKITETFQRLTNLWQGKSYVEDQVGHDIETLCKAIVGHPAVLAADEGRDLLGCYLNMLGEHLMSYPEMISAAETVLSRSLTLISLENGGNFKSRNLSCLSRCKAQRSEYHEAIRIAIHALTLNIEGADISAAATTFFTVLEYCNRIQEAESVASYLTEVRKTLEEHGPQIVTEDASIPFFVGLTYFISAEMYKRETETVNKALPLYVKALATFQTLPEDWKSTYEMQVRRINETDGTMAMRSECVDKETLLTEMNFNVLRLYSIVYGSPVRTALVFAQTTLYRVLNPQQFVPTMMAYNSIMQKHEGDLDTIDSLATQLSSCLSNASTSSISPLASSLEMKHELAQVNEQIVETSPIAAMVSYDRLIFLGNYHYMRHAYQPALQAYSALLDVLREAPIQRNSACEGFYEATLLQSLIICHEAGRYDQIKQFTLSYLHWLQSRQLPCKQGKLCLLFLRHDPQFHDVFHKLKACQGVTRLEQFLAWLESFDQAPPRGNESFDSRFVESVNGELDWFFAHAPSVPKIEMTHPMNIGHKHEFEET